MANEAATIPAAAACAKPAMTRAARAAARMEAKALLMELRLV